MKQFQPRHNAAETLRDQWECAVERATQALPHKDGLDTDAFKHAAGIRVRSSLHAAQSSYGNCTYPIAVCPVMVSGVLSYGTNEG